jgi:hypothetical protein
MLPQLIADAPPDIFWQGVMGVVVILVFGSWIILRPQIGKIIMPVNVCGFRDSPAAGTKTIINTTSRSKTWSDGLSPFHCGPCELYGIYVAQNMENAWQYAKVYAEHVDAEQNPTEDYFTWAQWGWNKKKADRYPMGKGKKPLFSYWDGEKYSYIEARKKIYAPLYAKAVEKTAAFATLRELYDSGEEIWLWDFDGYNHRTYNLSYEEVLNNEKKKMGHAFVLAMMLENQRIWE